MTDQSSHEEISVILDPNPSAIQVERVPILQQIGSQLRPELLQQLQGSTNAAGYFMLGELKRAGLDVEFDDRKLQLRIGVPAHLRKPSTIGFSNRLPPNAERAIPSSPFSAYANFRGGLDYVEQSASGANEGLQPLHVSIEAALNYRSWVLEGAGSYTEDAPSPFRRSDVRLVHDDPERMIRYSAGDLAYPTIGFQGFQPMVGLMLARNFGLQPYRITEPRGQTSFFLKTASKVEVMVNGRPVQTLQLPAGPHSLRDFMFTSGGNEVVLRITDAVGRTEIIHLSFFFDTRLLAQGEHEFSYSVGLPSRYGETGPDYGTNQPFLSMFHRMGLNDAVTAGVNFQGNGDQQLLGAEAVWATRLGTFQPDIGLTYAQGIGFDYGARLGYRYSDATRTWSPTWSVAIQYRGASFASLPNMDRALAAWDFSTRYSQRLPWRMNGGLGGTYQIARNDSSSWGINLFLTKTFARNWFADLTLDRRETLGGATDYRAYLSLTYLFSNHRQSIRTSYDSQAETARGDWQFRGRDAVGGFDGNLGFQHRPEDYSAFGALRYTGYRGEASVGHDVTTPESKSANVDSRTSVRLGTALVYAGGELAVSRPVQDSFAIVAVNPEFGAQDISVDAARDGRGAKADWLGSPVVPGLSSYLVRDISIEAPELPLGYDLGPSSHTVRPTYKSGTIVRVGKAVTAFVSGFLQDADGAPVPLQAGEIISLEGPNTPAIPVFTNRRGRFTAEGLHAGRYELRLFANPKAVVRFGIAKGTVGLHDVGTLRLPGKIDLNAMIK